MLQQLQNSDLPHDLLLLVVVRDDTLTVLLNGDLLPRGLVSALIHDGVGTLTQDATKLIHRYVGATRRLESERALRCCREYFTMLDRCKVLSRPLLDVELGVLSTDTKLSRLGSLALLRLLNPIKFWLWLNLLVVGQDGLGVLTVLTCEVSLIPLRPVVDLLHQVSRRLRQGRPPFFLPT